MAQAEILSLSRGKAIVDFPRFQLTKHTQILFNHMLNNTS